MRIVGQNNNIKSTLKKLFDSHFNTIKNLDYNSFVKETIENNPVVFNFNVNELTYFNDENEIQLLKDSQKDFHFSSIFNSSIKMDIEENLIKTKFKKDLKVVLNTLKKESLEKFSDLKRQALFLTHSDFPYAWGFLYGKGKFPILKKPEYFKFDYSNELFLADLKIDYSLIWSNFLALEKAILEKDLYNQISNTDIFNSLRASYVYKAYLLLFDVLNENQEELFEGFPLKKPFYIYGNEHGCEPINLFIIEKI